MIERLIDRQFTDQQINNGKLLTLRLVRAIAGPVVPLPAPFSLKLDMLKWVHGAVYIKCTANEPKIAQKANETR